MNEVPNIPDSFYYVNFESCRKPCLICELFTMKNFLVGLWVLSGIDIVRIQVIVHRRDEC